MIPIKICGITRAEDALMAERYGVSAVGFVFASESRRYIDPDTAGAITRLLGPFIGRIGVFVNADQDDIRRIARIAGLTAVQLHGDETPDYCAGLSDLTVIKAHRVGEGFIPVRLALYRVAAHLLDTLSASGCRGGTGQTFDWTIAQKCRIYGRIILSGGLTATNVASAITCAEPWAVDVSSGIEITPGVKDDEKMRLFIEAARSVHE